MTLFDTHTHVNFQPFLGDYQIVLERALANGVIINNVGTQWESSQRSVMLAEQFPAGIWASVGLHPLHLFQDVTEDQHFDGKTQTIKARAEQFDYDRYKALATSSKKVIAIGECGLDYYHFERSGLTMQRAVLTQLQITTLQQHIKLALELDKPIIIHCRDAATHTSTTIQAFLDLIEILRPYQGKLRGVIHCYTGLPEYLPHFLDLGFYVGFTGIVTFPNAKEVQASVQAMPLDRILLETDAPYLSPVPYRGKRNEPSYIQHVAEAIAHLRHTSLEQIAEATTANAQELFRV